MGREIRRVPLDFDWPLGKTWEGFLPPENLRSDPCPDCDRRSPGITAAREWVDWLTRLMLTLDDRPDHPYLASSYAPRRPPSPDIQEFGSGIAGREAGDMGHDGIDQYQATRKIIAAAGLDPDVWGFCPACRGEGWVERYPGQNADAEAWEPTGPPTGDGWQLWETVSEGSPISPVFPDKTGLVEWLCSPAYTWGGPMSRDTAERFVDFGWAPSFVFTPGRGLQTGEEFVGETT